MNLRELSKSLGLSQTTVSRALNGYPEVAESTRQRVLQAAARHNYRPNARALGLATGRTMTVGHIIPISSQNEMVNPIFTDFIAGASEAYAKNGYDMKLSVVPDAGEEETYREIATKGTIDGIILHMPRQNDSRIDLLQEIGLPFVVHGRAARRRVDYDWIDVNNRRAFQRATEFLLDLNHRRIALINGRAEMEFAMRRVQGFRDAMVARGVPVNDDFIRSDEMTEIFGYSAARDILKSKAPPTAFLSSSMITALGIRRAIEEAGLRMGRDVSVITYDDDLSYLKNSGDVPTFTAARSSVRQAGQLCAERLIELVQDRDLPPRQHLLEAELMVGGSTGPAPG